MVIINAKLHTMSHGVINRGYLTIENEKISSLGNMTDFSLQTVHGEILDLKGALVFPGFIDSHTHLGMLEDGVGDEGEDINEMSDPFTPHIRALDAINPFDKGMKEAWQAGITSIVATPGSANPIAGQIVALKTYGTCVDDMVVAEPLAIKFALGENPKRVYGAQDQQPMTRMAIAAIMREQLAKAQRYLQDKEFAQEHGDSLPELDFKYEALLPLLKGEIKAHFHAHRAYDIMTAVRIAKEFHLDYTLIHATEAHLIAPYLQAQQANIICGPIFGTRTKSELSNQTLENVAVLLKQGIQVAISSDHPELPAELLPLSAGYLRNYGVSEEQALCAITYYAAKNAGLEDRLGSLQVGLDADLVVYDVSPLDITGKPKMVIINGKQIL